MVPTVAYFNLNRTAQNNSFFNELLDFETFQDISSCWSCYSASKSAKTATNQAAAAEQRCNKTESKVYLDADSTLEPNL